MVFGSPGYFGGYQYLLVGYHGEPKVNLFHNIRIIQGLYYPKRLKVTYSTTRSKGTLNPQLTAERQLSRKDPGCRFAQHISAERAIKNLEFTCGSKTLPF